MTFAILKASPLIVNVLQKTLALADLTFLTKVRIWRTGVSKIKSFTQLSACTQKSLEFHPKLFVQIS